jgi:hypothetical protein
MFWITKEQRRQGKHIGEGVVGWDVAVDIAISGGIITSVKFGDHCELPCHHCRGHNGKYNSTIPTKTSDPASDSDSTACTRILIRSSYHLPRRHHLFKSMYVSNDISYIGSLAYYA